MIQPSISAVAPAAPQTDVPRLTTLSHGGGCGCKIAPDVLAALLRGVAPVRPYADLLVGSDTADDAAVYRLNDTQAVVATTDFFMPIVDDPFEFGRIAATNALSDIYAMGGTPLFALAIVGMPINVLPHAVIREILRGGASVCASADIPVAGGHSIDSVEPIYGLAVTGVVEPRQLKRNGAAQAGDVLILGKPLGIGIFSAAFKRGLLDAVGYATLIATATQLNLPGREFAAMPAVHAMTDVTGFGLLGHLLEMCRASGLAARLDAAQIPLLAGAAELAAAGVFTGASTRNWQAYGAAVHLASAPAVAMQHLLSDPQTSGGLLVACAPDAAAAVLVIFQRMGFAGAAVIGALRAGEASVDVV